MNIFSLCPDCRVLQPVHMRGEYVALIRHADKARQGVCPGSEKIVDKGKVSDDAEG